MGMSFSTVEEKKQVRWFVMRAYKNEKMAEDRLKDKEYGLEYFIPKHYAVKTYHGMKSTRLVPVIPSLVFRPRQPLADHRIQETVQLPAIRHVEKKHGYGIYHRARRPDGQFHPNSFPA